MLKYLLLEKNGNIVNSVNYPACDAGVCETAARVAICHKNIPDMLTRFTGVFSSKSVNIANMERKKKGDLVLRFGHLGSDNKGIINIPHLQKFASLSSNPLMCLSARK